MPEHLVALKIDQKYPDSGKITCQGIRTEKDLPPHIEDAYLGSICGKRP